ncbi:MAG: transglycosylase domain-containing protein [Calditrichota bacterium]
MELYLNVVEWGPGIYGIQAAAEHYYGIPAAHLSRSQSARLAAILPAPLSRQPSQMDLYSREIQGRMRQFGW